MPAAANAVLIRDEQPTDPPAAAFRPLRPPFERAAGPAFKPKTGTRISICGYEKGRGATICFHLGADVLAQIGVKSGERVVVLVATDPTPLIWLRRARRDETEAYRVRVAKGSASGGVRLVTPQALAPIKAIAQPHRPAPGGGVFIEPAGAIADAVAAIAALRDARS